MSPGKLLQVEQKKLDDIYSLSTNLVDLKKRQSQLSNEKDNLLKEKCERIKKMRLDEFKGKSLEMDEKEKDLCKKTNLLVDQLVNTCGEIPFNKALIDILRNFKGIITLSKLFFLHYKKTFIFSWNQHNS